MEDTVRFHCVDHLSEDHQILFSRFGRGPTATVPHQTVHSAFESTVDSYPEDVAARFGEQAITYKQLDIAANRLANHLLDNGLHPRGRVCLVVQRSIEMLIGIFAVLKTGCQYVPIDGGITTTEVMKHVFRDTRAAAVLCLPQFEEKIRAQCSKETNVVVLGKDVELFCSKQRPGITVSPDDGVYAIYTSGSTGKPKGVDVSHKNVTNALLLGPANLGITVGSKVAQVLNIAFDMGAWEILGCLMNGGTLHIRGSDWKETLREVDTLISTPSILSKYRHSAYPNIKTVVTGGEPCPQALADEWAKGTSFLNICGPTEITILNSAHHHISSEPISIGRPLPNTTVYILDENENPAPIGTRGTMWVGGSGVTKGYINQPDLTMSRYKIDRFSNDGSMMFNTGDIVSWQDNGSLRSHGRVDDQVKIKGFRVELDGVAATIEKFPGITRACATLIDDILHGFYIATTFIDEHDLDEFARHHLPYYSIPEKWNYCATIPLTSNGKVDKEYLARIALRATRVISSRKASTFITKELYHPAPIRKDIQQDPEKAIALKEDIVVSSNLSDFNVSTASISEVIDKLPPKNGFRGQRWLRHRALIVYKKFFTFAMLANLSAAIIILYRRVTVDRPMIADIAIAVAANVTMAVLMRSEPVINVLFTIFCSVPTSWPLSIRRHCARIFHIGGIHSGCALAAVVWFFIFTVGASLDIPKPRNERCIGMPPLILSYIILVIFIAMASMSHPKIRAQHHDAWEVTHRFGGWTALILLWVQTFLATKDLHPHMAPSKAYLYSPPVWMLTVATMAIIFPWLFLRKVPVRSEVLSSHAIRLHFDHTTPVVGTAVRLADRPLVDWHGFATITNKNGKGFSLVVSNAGDFTKRTIERAPSSIYIRGIPACGVLRIATLFKSVVLVATGSGIGPCLAVILAKKTPCRILWTAPNPEQTFGKEIVDSVFDTDPKAIIHNTRTMGKPDMELMTYRLYKESAAEAVCVISNKKFTTTIVYAMESRGIPAYGAIFDS